MSELQKLWCTLDRSSYEQGYIDAITKVKELASSYSVAQYGEEGAQISMLILLIVEEALNATKTTDSN